MNRKRNGVGMILKEEYAKNIVEVKRVSDGIMGVRLKIEGKFMNVVSGYKLAVRWKRKRNSGESF